MNDREERNPEPLVPFAQVGALLALSDETVERLVEWGMLQAYTEPVSGDIYIVPDSLRTAQRWLKEMPALLRETDAVSGRSVAQYVAASAGYDAVLARLHKLWDPEVAEVWLESPNAHLNGATPLEVLGQRGLDRVLRAIEAEDQGAYAGNERDPLTDRPEHEIEFELIRGAAGFIAAFQSFHPTGAQRKEIAELASEDGTDPSLRAIVRLLASLDLYLQVTVREARPDDEFLIAVTAIEPNDVGELSQGEMDDLSS